MNLSGVLLLLLLESGPSIEYIAFPPVCFLTLEFFENLAVMFLAFISLASSTGIFISMNLSSSK